MKCPRCSSCSVIDRCRASTARQPALTSHVSSSFATTSTITTKFNLIKQNSNSHITPRTTHHPTHMLPFASRPSMDWTTDDNINDVRSSPSSSSTSTDSQTSTSPSPTQPQLEFGQCSSKQCGFRFCVACLCEFDRIGTGHSNGRGGSCTRAQLRIDSSRPLVKSNSSDSSRTSHTAKRSRDNLRRLGSLDV